MSSRIEPKRENAAAWWWAIAAVTAIAIALRLPGLNGDLWIDEVISLLESFRSPFPGSLTEFPGDNKHPLYALVAHSFRAVFGEHAWSLRMPAVLFGAACVPALYLLGSRIASRREAFAASALLAVSYHHVWFSQNARGYTMLAFWAILGTWALLRAIDERRLGAWMAYALISGLGVYTHLTYAFTMAGQGAVVLAGVMGFPRSGKRIELRLAVAGYLAAAAMAFLLYAPMLGRVIDFFVNKESNLKGVSTPQWALAEGIRVLSMGFGALGASAVAILLFAGAVGIAGVVSYFRWAPAATFLMIAPGLVTLMLAFFGRGTMYPRFFFAFIGFAFLIAMRGVFVTAGWIAARILRRPGSSELIGDIGAGLIVAVSAFSVPLSWQAPKQDFTGPMQFIDSNVPSGQVVATADVTSLVYQPLYGRQWKALRSDADLRQLRAAGSVWLVYTFPRYLMKFDPGIAATVERECGSARRFRGTVGGGDVFVCNLGKSR